MDEKHIGFKPWEAPSRKSSGYQPSHTAQPKRLEYVQHPGDQTKEGPEPAPRPDAVLEELLPLRERRVVDLAFLVNGRPSVQVPGNTAADGSCMGG